MTEFVRQFNEVTYQCQCGNKQVVRYFQNDTPYPALCCTSCRAGLSSTMSYGEMAARGVGMQAVGEAVLAS